MLERNHYKTIARRLKDGALMLYPTETVYGLGCDARNGKAVRALARLKGRGAGKSFIVLVRDMKMAKRIARISPIVEAVLMRVWPAALTVVVPLKSRSIVAPYFKKSIALRISPHPFVQKLFSYISFPIVSSSANRSGELPARNVESFAKQVKYAEKKVGVIVDAGTLPKRAPSTIISFLDDKPKVIREGAYPSRRVLRLWTRIVRKNSAK